MSDDLITVFMASTEFEAETVAATLREAGLPVAVFPSTSNALGIALGGAGSLFGVPVQVRDCDCARARELLKAQKLVAESVDWDSVDVGSRDEDVSKLGTLPPLARAVGNTLVRLGLIAAAAAIVLGLLAMILSLGGCAYRLEGRAVEGSFDGAAVVPSNSEVMGSHIPQARIQLWRDPDSLGRTLAAEAQSGSDGRFVLEIAAFGAGWLDEQWSIRVTRVGYTGLEQHFKLPMKPDDVVLEITLTPGRESKFRDREGSDALKREADSFGSGSIRNR